MKKIISYFSIILGLTILSLNPSQAQLTQGEIRRAIESKSIRNDVTRYSIGDLWVLRNYLFAKHGYQFKNRELQTYFEGEFEFSGQYENVNDKLSEEDRTLITFLLETEKSRKNAAKTCEILTYTFQLEQGELLVPEELAFRLPVNSAYEFIAGQKLSEDIYLIEIESAYTIGDVECCGGVGAKNQVLKQLIFYPSTGELKEVPRHVTLGNYIERVIENKYLFVLNEILSGAHRLQIYSIEDFHLLGEIQELESYEMNGDEDGIEIWEFTDDELAYPFKNRQLYYFKGSELIKTDTIEKVNASWYFAG